MTLTAAEKCRRWREKHPGRNYESQKRFRANHPEYVQKYVDYMREYQRQNVLIVNGKRMLVRKRPRPDGICELCNGYYIRLEYHHWDDTHPSLGFWLCPKCHRMAECVDKGFHVIYLQMKKDMVLIQS